MVMCVSSDSLQVYLLLINTIHKSFLTTHLKLNNFLLKNIFIVFKYLFYYMLI